MLAKERFREELSPILPQQKQPFRLIHIRTQPRKCRKLIFTTRDDKTVNTVSYHLFVLAHQEINILALELFLYQSPLYCTIFISKADTSGHYYGDERINFQDVVRALLKGVLRYYVPTNKLLRLCLFAKAEEQYLFMGSKNNSRKHVLEGPKLIKWWISCIDGLSNEFQHIERCNIQIPGLSSHDVKSYIPRNSKLYWVPGNIFWKRSPDERELAVRLIPRFPDDPKRRFLDFLVNEHRASKVYQKQFWIELESRQEFRLGKTVAVIGLQGIKKFHTKLVGCDSVSYPQSMKIKEVLLGSNYKTKEDALFASNELFKRTSKAAVIEIAGCASTIESSKNLQNNSPPRVLDPTLVRRKLGH